MPTSFERVAQRLARARALPFRALVYKAATFVASRAGGSWRLRGCTRVGERPRAAGWPLITNRGVIVIGDDVILNSVLGPVELVADPGGRIEIGDDVFLNFGTRVHASLSVSIGRNVALGPYCVVADRSAVPAAGSARDAVARPVVIGADAWLGAHVTVLGGAIVGEGSTIAAGSVVTGRIPPGVVAGGDPARVLRPVRDSAAPPRGVAR